jgi:hypothetical protein
VIAGEAEGDHAKAVDEDHRLLLEHLDFDKLRATFISDLRVQPPLLDTRLFTRRLWRAFGTVRS